MTITHNCHLLADHLATTAQLTESILSTVESANNIVDTMRAVTCRTEEHSFDRLSVG